MDRKRKATILDIVEAKGDNVPIETLAKALGESIATTVKLVTYIEDEGDCIVQTIGSDRAQWRVTSIRPNPS